MVTCKKKHNTYNKKKKWSSVVDTSSRSDPDYGEDGRRNLEAS